MPSLPSPKTDGDGFYPCKSQRIPDIRISGENPERGGSVLGASGCVRGRGAGGAGPAYRTAAADSAYDFPLAHRVLEEQGIDFFVRPQPFHDRTKAELKRDAFEWNVFFHMRMVLIIIYDGFWYCILLFCFHVLCIFLSKEKQINSHETTKISAFVSIFVILLDEVDLSVLRWIHQFDGLESELFITKNLIYACNWASVSTDCRKQSTIRFKTRRIKLVQLPHRRI